MQYQTHVATSLVFGLPVICLTTTESKAFLIATGLLTVGALLPDLDHPGSYIGKRVPLLPQLLNHTTGHRGLTHSLLANSGVAFTGLLYAPLFYLALGYFLHLLEDSFSKSRVAWLQPFSKRKWGWGLYKTGGGVERVWFYLMDILLVVEIVVFKPFLGA
jgi:inner membrane protein